MRISIGQKLGRYRIEEEIGAGGMGVVYRAYDEKLERDLAIKVLSPGTLDNEVARKRFRNEARMLSRLNHPAIQTIYDFDTVDGTDILVSELVPGQSLDARLASGPLPEKYPTQTQTRYVIARRSTKANCFAFTYRNNRKT